MARRVIYLQKERDFNRGRPKRAKVARAVTHATHDADFPASPAEPPLEVQAGTIAAPSNVGVQRSTTSEQMLTADTAEMSADASAADPSPLPSSPDGATRSTTDATAADAAGAQKFGEFAAPPAPFLRADCATAPLDGPRLHTAIPSTRPWQAWKSARDSGKAIGPSSYTATSVRSARGGAPSTGILGRIVGALLQFGGGIDIVTNRRDPHWQWGFGHRKFIGLSQFDKDKWRQMQQEAGIK